MKISLNWINDYVEIGHDASLIAEILINLGFPCESIQPMEDDCVIDVEVTSNRGDCLGHIGVARELAAAIGKPLRLPEVRLDESPREVRDVVSVDIAEASLCGRYTARVIEGVKVGPAPDWMRKRLEAVGMRSVSNAVDATNYAMMETGQPPHAFDCAKIYQGKIIVRMAGQGEALVSIDGTRCELSPDMLVIADPKGPVAVAGVMGGLATEVVDQTTTILLEDACFDPVGIRTTSRRLALPSEASYRFGRIVDIERIDWASQRTAQLICQVAGGKVLRGVVDAYPRKPKQIHVRLRLARIKVVLGIEVAGPRVVEILQSLGFEPKAEGEVLHCTVPSWRSDVYREADLIEEVARCHGYDKVPTADKIRIQAVPVDHRQQSLMAVGSSLTACGYYETINVDFLDKALSDLFLQSGDGETLSVKDVSRKGSNLLRQSLLGSLLTVLKTNIHAKNLPCRIYEISDTFIPRTENGGLPLERTRLALVADGDLRQLRAAVDRTVCTMVRDAVVEFRPSPITWAQAGADIMVNGRLIGQAGVFSDAVIRCMDIKNAAPVGADVDFDLLLEMATGFKGIRPIPRFPAIERDLSIVVNESVPWAEVVRAVHAVGSAELEEVRFVEVYQGRGIPSGAKSVTLSLRFRDPDGTLTHDTVDRFQSDILASLSVSVGAQLRTL